MVGCHRVVGKQAMSHYARSQRRLRRLGHRTVFQWVMAQLYGEIPAWLPGATNWLN